MHLWKLFPLVFSELCRRQEHCELLKPGVLVLLSSLTGSQHTCGCWKAITTVIICILLPKVVLLWKFNLVKSWLLFVPILNCSVFPWALPNSSMVWKGYSAGYRAVLFKCIKWEGVREMVESDTACHLSLPMWDWASDLMMKAQY